MKKNIEKLYKNLPETSGVYIMRDEKRKILYIGKAGNLRRRVSSYFLRPHDVRIEKLVSKINKIDIRKTDTALEALILESNLIKKHKPPFNIREKDDKSFLYIEITKEEYPRVLLVRDKDREKGVRYGPFTSAGSAREAYKLLRKIFVWNTHTQKSIGKLKRPCFDYEIGICPGTCIYKIDKKEYKKTIINLKLFLSGEKKKIIKNLKKEMRIVSKKLEFEKAEKLKRRIFVLEHIQDIALINENEIGNWSLKIKNSVVRRVEGYDISNISGASAVGVMVVFTKNKGNWKPKKSEYRKFKIRSFSNPNDIGMMLEVLERRFRHTWDKPDLILVDGGVGQTNATKQILKDLKLSIPVVGIAKGVKRKKNDFFGRVPIWVDKDVLIKVRDEAHRFAITFHRKVRDAKLITRK